MGSEKQKGENTMSKETIRNFQGQILGTLEDQGSKIVARDFYGVNLGYYDKNADRTHDFYGRIVGSGNLLSGLISQAAVKNGYSID